MKCPVDNQLLTISERNGIEIDYCPQCRGVWLDRGELDKLIERASDSSGRDSSDYRQDRADNYDSDRRHSYDTHYDHKKKKRENFLGDLFDF